jgi:hypothetical protein
MAENFIAFSTLVSFQPPINLQGMNQGLFIVGGEEYPKSLGVRNPNPGISFNLEPCDCFKVMLYNKGYN